MLGIILSTWFLLRSAVSMLFLMVDKWLHRYSRFVQEQCNWKIEPAPACLNKQWPCTLNRFHHIAFFRVDTPIQVSKQRVILLFVEYVWWGSFVVPRSTPLENELKHF